MGEGTAFPQEGFPRLRDALSRRFAVLGEWWLFRSLRALDLLEAHLRQPLRVAVMGEQASGKSSLINMLLREDVVPTGALAGVRAYLLLRYGAMPELNAVAADGSRARLTPRALAKMSSPGPETRTVSSRMMISGTSEAAQRKEWQDADFIGQAMRPSSLAEGATRLIEIIQPRAFLRRAELVEGRGCAEGAGKSLLRHVLPFELAIWCTLGTQAWKESERQSWRRLPAKLRGRAILLITYKDAIGAAKDEAKLINRMERDAGPLFSNIMLISLRQAAEAIGPDGAIADQSKWQRSGAAAFEAVLLGHLAELDRARRVRSLRFLRRLAALSNESGAFPTIVSAPVAETAKHFQRLIRDFEEWQAEVGSDFSNDVSAWDSADPSSAAIRRQENDRR